MFKETGVINFWRVRQLDIYMLGHKGFIAGGVFKNILNNEPFKDVDIFFHSRGDYEAAVSHYEDQTEEYKLYYQNPKVRAYKNNSTGHTVELISHMFGTPEEVLSAFDFSVTKMAYFKKEVETQELLDDGEQAVSIEYRLIHHPDFFEHLHMKRLVLEADIKYPISTFERTYRYTRYGFGLCKNSKVNLLNAIRAHQGDIDMSDELYNGID